MLEDYFSDPQAERDAELEQQVDDALGGLVRTWSQLWLATREVPT